MSGAGTPGISLTLRQRLAQLPRDKADTLLLLGAALMVLAPHFGHLPLWSSAAIGALLLWRAALTWRGLRMPPRWLLLPLALAAMGGVYASFGSVVGRDPGVAMLALLLAFKLLEMRARRDLLVVVFLSFFVLLTHFFYAQSIATALWTGATLTALLTVLQTFQYTGAMPPLTQRLRLSAHMLALATPLALLMFIGFPRINGPLWGMPGDASSGRSGISDSMAPGTLSSLAQSDEVAFRVRFLDERPAQPLQQQLYWRSIVLGDYDGRTWTRVPRRSAAVPAQDIAIRARGQAVRYEVTMEPSGKRWLAALELSGPTLALPGLQVRDSAEMEFFTTTPIERRTRFSASAYLDFDLQAKQQADAMRRWLELPAGYNPRTLALARQLRDAAAQPAQAAQLSQAILNMFRRQAFHYTLQPPLGGRDLVDDFLFTSKSGFCEHYAGAYVVLMRAMGVPARVVTGYQGGERNPVDGYLTVRQSDAHAWAEFWAPGQGWRRVDPTAAVAPERITRNLARALPAPTGFGLAPLFALQQDPDSWLAQLRFHAAALNNAWNQYILDYNPERQRHLLAQLGKLLLNWRAAVGLALGAALAAALVWALAWRRRQKATDPLDALYQAFCRQQARHGYARQADEGPQRYAVRLRTMAATAQKHAAMDEFLLLYGTLRYGVPASESRSASLATLTTLLPLCR
ncbi:MAG: DUF3488 and transglutaminase-like domain-containing protein [Duganella sp.]